MPATPNHLFLVMAAPPKPDPSGKPAARFSGRGFETKGGTTYIYSSNETDFLNIFRARKVSPYMCFI